MREDELAGGIQERCSVKSCSASVPDKDVYMDFDLMLQLSRSPRPHFGLRACSRTLLVATRIN
jgi:hypothetical protein